MTRKITYFLKEGNAIHALILQNKKKTRGPKMLLKTLTSHKSKPLKWTWWSITGWNEVRHCCCVPVANLFDYKRKKNS